MDRVVAVLIAFLLGAVVSAASFYFALKWRFQVEHESPPTVLPERPPSPEALNAQAQLIREWFEGAEEEGEEV